MDTFVRLSWDSPRLGPMTEATIRQIHGDSRRNRLSKYVYDANDEIEGTSRECTGYVLEGSIQMTVGDASESFKRGDVFRFSGGDYIAKTERSEGAQLIWVWLLPEGVG